MVVIFKLNTTFKVFKHVSDFLILRKNECGVRESNFHFNRQQIPFLEKFMLPVCCKYEEIIISLHVTRFYNCFEKNNILQSFFQSIKSFSVFLIQYW